MAAYLATACLASAQTYVDTTEDQDDVYVDFYDTPTVSTGCASEVKIVSTFNKVTAGATAYYPATAHVQQSAANIAGNTYLWTRTVYVFGQLKGGACGAISKSAPVSISIHLGVSVNLYQFSTITNGFAYYYPIENCNTKCRHSYVTGPPTPAYSYVIENYNWFTYSTGPTGYYCSSFYAVPSNNVPTTGAKCYDTGLP